MRTEKFFESRQPPSSVHPIRAPKPVVGRSRWALPVLVFIDLGMNICGVAIFVHKCHDPAQPPGGEGMKGMEVVEGVEPFPFPYPFPNMVEDRRSKIEEPTPVPPILPVRSPRLPPFALSGPRRSGHLIPQIPTMRKVARPTIAPSSDPDGWGLFPVPCFREAGGLHHFTTSPLHHRAGVKMIFDFRSSFFDLP